MYMAHDVSRLIATKLLDIARYPERHRHSDRIELYRCCEVEPYLFSDELIQAHLFVF